MDRGSDAACAVLAAHLGFSKNGNFKKYQHKKKDPCRSIYITLKFGLDLWGHFLSDTESFCNSIIQLSDTQYSLGEDHKKKQI